MSIIDFLEFGPHMLALTSQGHLLSWDLTSLSHQSLPHFPFFRSHFSSHLTSHTPISLHRTPSSICVCTNKQLILMDTGRLQEALRKYKLTSMKQDLVGRRIKCSGEGDEIRCMVVVDCENTESEKENEMVEESINCLIYGTKSGQIFKIPIQNNKDNAVVGKAQRICDIHPASHKITISKPDQITSILSYRDHSLLLVSTSQGRLLIVNTNINKVVDDITANNQLCLDPIKTITSAHHKFFTLHQHYVIQWSSQLQKPLGYYGCNSAYDVLITDQMLDSKHKLLICGGSQFVQVLQQENVSQIETSLQSVRVVKELGGKLCFGGSNGMIEIFKEGVQCLLLFRQI